MSPIYSLMLVSPVWRDWSSVLFYVHRDSKTITVLGTGAQDGHLDFHTAPELCTEFITGVFVCFLYFISSILAVVIVD